LPPTIGFEDMILPELLTEKEPECYLLAADYFEDNLRDYGFADYIRLCYEQFKIKGNVFYQTKMDFPTDYYGRRSNTVRDIKRYIVKELQFIQINQYNSFVENDPIDPINISIGLWTA
jgi:hypothetical protein